MAAKTKEKIQAPDELVKLYLNRQMAEQRLQLAQQTVAGAAQAFIDADSRCKGVAEYLYGPEATLNFENGKLTVDRHGNVGGKTVTPTNGKDDPAFKLVPVTNRAARRALAKKK